MTMNINIDENFPYPGQDNDSQVFRDNFKNIKDNLTSAKTDIDALLLHSARDDKDTNDFNGHVISNAVLSNTSEKVFDFTAVQSSSFSVDFNNGPYQLAKIGADVTIALTNFPTDSTGRIRLHLTSSSTAKRIITFSATNGSYIKYSNDFPLTDAVITNGIANLRLGVTSTTDPKIVEIWKLANTFYIKYIGEFTEHGTKQRPCLISISTGSEIPSSPIDGDLWLNTTSGKLKVYYESAWVDTN